MPAAEIWKRFSRLKFDPKNCTRCDSPCTSSCAIWLDPKEPAGVCIASGYVHLCGKHCQLIPEIEESSGVGICPLTGIVTQQQVCILTRQFNKDTGKPMDHMGPWKTIRARRPFRSSKTKRTALPSAEVLFDIAASVLWGKDRLKIRKIENARASKKIATELRKISPQNLTFFSLQAIVNSYRRFVPDVQVTAKEIAEVRDLVLGINRWTHDHNSILPCNPVSLTCTWLTLLADGVESQGQVAVKMVPSIRRLLPPPALMSCIDGVQCRSISAGTRKLKKYFFAEDGDVVASRRFKPYSLRCKTSARRSSAHFTEGVSRAGAVPLGSRIPERSGH